MPQHILDWQGSSEGATWPLSPARTALTTRFDPYPAAGRYGFVFGPDTDLITRGAWESGATMDGATIGGTAGVLDSAVAAADGFTANVPLGPITCAFTRDGLPYQAPTWGVVVNLIMSTAWTFPASPTGWDKLIVSSIDAAGADISWWSLDSVGTVDVPWQTWVMQGRPIADPSYGFRIWHSNPGWDNPVILSLFGCWVDSVDGRRGYLRQRQIPGNRQRQVG
jgi:hypothetical protein